MSRRALRVFGPALVSACAALSGCFTSDVCKVEPEACVDESGSETAGKTEGEDSSEPEAEAERVRAEPHKL